MWAYAWLLVATKSCFDRIPIHFCVFSLCCYHTPSYNYVYYICGYIFLHMFVYPSVYHLCISPLQLAPHSRASAPATMKKYRESQHQRWSFRLETVKSSRGSPPTTCPLSYDGQSFAKPQVAVQPGVQRSRVRSRARGYRHARPLEAALSTAQEASGSLSKGERSVCV